MRKARSRKSVRIVSCKSLIPAGYVPIADYSDVKTVYGRSLRKAMCEAVPREIDGVKLVTQESEYRTGPIFVDPDGAEKFKAIYDAAHGAPIVRTHAAVGPQAIEALRAEIRELKEAVQSLTDQIVGTAPTV